MKNKQIMRAFWLALSFFCSAPSFAHSLPGSQIQLSQESEKILDISIEFALKDLVIAAPELNSLKSDQIAQELSPDKSKTLSTYLRQHLTVQQNNQTLGLTSLKARLETRHNHHVGTFVVVITNIQAQLLQSNVFPLTLTYDAIQHEIRSHRVDVDWKNTQGTLENLINYGYHQLGATPESYLLTLDKP